MKYKHLHLFILTLGAVLGAAVRFWTLHSAIDSQGLPVTGHPATIAFIAVCIVFTLILGVLSLKSPGRGVSHTVLTFSGAQRLPALAGAVLVFLGAVITLFQMNGIGALVLFLLGAAAAVCMLLVAQLRRHGNQNPLPELIPVVYLLVALILNFKNWSTDPVILDYCDLLFAMIFTLLAFYGSAGFVFDKGQPRRTLFYGSAAILFCAMAAVSCFMGGNMGSALGYCGCGLWLIPVAQCLLAPSEAPPKKEKTKE